MIAVFAYTSAWHERHEHPIMLCSAEEVVDIHICEIHCTAASFAQSSPPHPPSPILWSPSYAVLSPLLRAVCKDSLFTAFSNNIRQESPWQVARLSIPFSDGPDSWANANSNTARPNVYGGEVLGTLIFHVWYLQAVQKSVHVHQHGCRIALLII